MHLVQQRIRKSCLGFELCLRLLALRLRFLNSGMPYSPLVSSLHQFIVSSLLLPAAGAACAATFGLACGAGAAGVIGVGAAAGATCGDVAAQNAAAGQCFPAHATVQLYNGTLKRCVLFQRAQRDSPSSSTDVMSRLATLAIFFGMIFVPYRTRLILRVWG